MMKITTPIRQDIREAMDKIARRESKYINLGDIYVEVAYLGEDRTECVQITISNKITMRFHIQGEDVFAIEGDQILYGTWDDISFEEIEKYIKKFLSI